MKNKYKIILIICVIIGICSILVGSIAYYRIVVEGNIKGSTGNAVFVLKDENSNVWNNKEINLGKVNPGDSGSFTVTMDASGSTVDMYATLELDRTNLPTNLKFYTTSEHKSELHKYYSFLEQNGTKSETLTIYWYWNPYISDEEDSKFINKESVEANIRVSAVQISGYVTMKNGYDFSTGGTEFWNNTYRPYIRTINFGNDLSNLPSSCTEENLCFDVTSDGNTKKVYGYLIDSGLKDSNNPEQILYNLYIVSEVPIFAPADCTSIFERFNKITQINFNNNFNTSKVTNMSDMFSGCSSLTSLDLSSFNTSNVTDMNSMFEGCSSLTNLDLSSFNTSKVTNMHYMFYRCLSLTNLDLSSFNTSNINDMSRMFYACESLTSLDLSGFNTSKVTTMYGMFYGCSSLTNLDLSSFNTSNVTNMGGSDSHSGMFYGCLSLTSLDLSNFNTSKVTDMGYMFSVCSSLTSLDLSSFDTSNVKNMMEMFSRCSSLTSLDLSSFNTSKVTKMTQMFYSCINVQTQITIRSEITYIYNMFLNAATKPGAIITVNYTSSYLSDLVDQMIATKSSNSNVVKGNQI